MRRARKEHGKEHQYWYFKHRIKRKMSRTTRNPRFNLRKTLLLVLLSLSMVLVFVLVQGALFSSSSPLTAHLDPVAVTKNSSDTQGWLASSLQWVQRGRQIKGDILNQTKQGTSIKNGINAMKPPHQSMLQRIHSLIDRLPDEFDEGNYYYRKRYSHIINDSQLSIQRRISLPMDILRLEKETLINNDQNNNNNEQTDRMKEEQSSIKLCCSVPALWMTQSTWPVHLNTWLTQCNHRIFIVDSHDYGALNHSEYRSILRNQQQSSQSNNNDNNHTGHLYYNHSESQLPDLRYEMIHHNNKYKGKVFKGTFKWYFPLLALHSATMVIAYNPYHPHLSHQSLMKEKQRMTKYMMNEIKCDITRSISTIIPCRNILWQWPFNQSQIPFPKMTMINKEVKDSSSDMFFHFWIIPANVILNSMGLSELTVSKSGNVGIWDKTLAMHLFVGHYLTKSTMDTPFHHSSSSIIHRNGNISSDQRIHHHHYHSAARYHRINQQGLCDWNIKVDSDGIALPNHFRAMVAGLHPRIPHYLGEISVRRLLYFNQNVSYAGGGALAVSKGAMDRLMVALRSLRNEPSMFEIADSRRGKRNDAYLHCARSLQASEDVMTAVCLRSVGVLLERSLHYRDLSFWELKNGFNSFRPPPKYLAEFPIAFHPLKCADMSHAHSTDVLKLQGLFQMVMDKYDHSKDSGWFEKFRSQLKYPRLWKHDAFINGKWKFDVSELMIRSLDCGFCSDSSLAALKELSDSLLL